MSVINHLKNRILWQAGLQSEDRSLSFDAVYQQYHNYVRQTLFWMLNYSQAKESVDDLVQEVFLKIWISLTKFKGQSNIKTWVYRIAINTALDYLRAQKVYLNSTQSIETSEYLKVLDPKDSAESTLATQMLIHKAISGLSEKQRTVFVLFYKQEMSVSEISEVLGISEGTVKSRLHTGRSLFTQALEKLGVSYER